MTARNSALIAAAYAVIDAQPSYEDDPDRTAQAIGRYDGLKRAYVLLTGRSEQDVANEVVTWYVRTPEYQAIAAAQHTYTASCDGHHAPGPCPAAVTPVGGKGDERES